MRTSLRILAGAACLALSTAVLAQWYSAGDPDNSGNSTYNGGYTSPTLPAPPYARYLGARCNGMLDAIRTADLRGISRANKQQLQMAFDRDCSEEVTEAYDRMAKEQVDKRKQRKQTSEQEQAELERVQARERMCGESKRLLIARRALTNLNDGEKAELQRFEDNYRARCLAPGGPK